MAISENDLNDLQETIFWRSLNHQLLKQKKIGKNITYEKS